MMNHGMSFLALCREFESLHSSLSRAIAADSKLDQMKECESAVRVGVAAVKAALLAAEDSIASIKSTVPVAEKTYGDDLSIFSAETYCEIAMSVGRDTLEQCRTALENMPHLSPALWRHYCGDKLVNWLEFVNQPIPGVKLKNLVSEETGAIPQEQYQQTVSPVRTRSRWIDAAEFISVLRENRIGTSDSTIKRKKSEWQAESQPGSNNQRFCFILEDLDAMNIKYPQDWKAITGRQ